MTDSVCHSENDCHSHSCGTGQAPYCDYGGCNCRGLFFLSKWHVKNDTEGFLFSASASTVDFRFYQVHGFILVKALQKPFR